VSEGRNVLAGVLRAMGAKVVTLPISALATFGATSLTITSIGAERYGVLSIVTGLYLMVPFADLGLGAGVINAVASGQQEYARAVARRTFRILWVPALIVAIVGMAGASMFSWSSVLGVSGAPDRCLDLVTGVSLTLFALSIPLGIGPRILVGLKRNAVAVYLSLLSSLTALTGVLALGFIGAPSDTYALPMPLGMLITNLVSLVVAQRFTGFSIFGSAQGDAVVTVRSLFSVGLPMMVLMISLPLLFNSHRVILSLRSDAMEIARYSLMMQLYNPFWSVVSIGGTALWPYFASGRARSANATPSLAVLGYPLALFGSFGVAVAIALVVAGGPVADLVSSGQISLSISLLLAASALILVQSVQQVPGMFLTDGSGLWFQAACVIAALPAALFSMWVLSPLFGAAAPILCTAGSVLLFQFVPALSLSIRRIARS